MGVETAISWADATFNPWWGCARVSEACQHCYAESWAKRTGHDVWGKNGPRRFFGDKHWAEPLRWNRDAEAAGVPRRVFCASMADVFENHPAVGDARTRLWRLIEQTPHLRWMLLTKRPENVRQFVPMRWLSEWPSHVWLGTTVETQRWADERIPLLLAVPAAVRFLSMEPLLGPVDLDPWLRRISDEARAASQFEWTRDRIDWVIVGGESGGGARPMHPEWARQIRDACQRWSVPFHLKQWGEWAPDLIFDETLARLPDSSESMTRVGKKSAGRELDGRTWDEVPATST